MGVPSTIDSEADPSLASRSRPVSELQTKSVVSHSDTPLRNDYPIEKNLNTDDGHDDDDDDTSAANHNNKRPNDPESPIPLAAPPGTAPAPEYTFPDGGVRAWSIVLGSAFLAFGTFGYANSYGIFQDYYQTTLLRDSSPSDIAWIGSIQYSLVLLPGIISGRLIDLGYLRLPLVLACILQVTASFLTAECTKYWQFLLCQGFALGLAAGFGFGPTLAVISHWFFKKRPLAFGIAATGSSIGGVVFPLAVKKLLVEVGFKWTMRITGFMILCAYCVAISLMRTRLPPKNVKGGLFNFPVFKSLAFSLYAFACFTGFLGVYTVLTYSSVAAYEAGISNNLALSLVAIANGSSSFGRVASGYLGGRFGSINVLIPFTMLAGAMSWAWPYATISGPGGLIVVMIIYGIATGAFVGLIATPVSNKAFGQQGDIGRRIGMIFTIAAVGALVGTPISGAIHSATGGYKTVGWYAGSLTFLSVICMLLAKRVASGSWTEKF